jgi:hypothetical protein
VQRRLSTARTFLYLVTLALLSRWLRQRVAKTVNCQNIFFYLASIDGGKRRGSTARNVLHLNRRALLSSWLRQSTARNYFFI